MQSQDQKREVEQLRARLVNLAERNVNAAIVDAYNEITRLQAHINILEQDNKALSMALTDLKTCDAGMRFLDEAFNSGDGVYRP